MAPIVCVEHVSKKFCRRLRHSLWYGLTDLAGEFIARKPAPNLQLRPAEFLALDDISFELEMGECVGLIGPNGAGKSTLLKMLNGLIRPDKGKITIRGQVGALIELGAGFSPVLSGRENIYINGAVLGFSKRDIDAKFDAIVDFAELGDAIDAPVHTYSSGMYVRLGFAVAAQLNPNILLVDEILAVGDAAFRLKCMRTVRERVDAGTSIIFVSHDMRNIMTVCNRVIWLDQGRLCQTGVPSEICRQYERLAMNRLMNRPGGLNTTYFDPDAGARFVAVRSGESLSSEFLEFPQDRQIEIEFDIETDRPFKSLYFNYALRTLEDVMIIGAREPLAPLTPCRKRFTVRWHLPALNLMPGTYKLEIGLAHEYRWGTHIQELRPACVFSVTGTTLRAGVCELPVSVTLQSVSPNPT